MPNPLACTNKAQPIALSVWTHKTIGMCYSNCIACAKAVVGANNPKNHAQQCCDYCKSVHITLPGTPSEVRARVFRANKFHGDCHEDVLKSL
jgi:hypothetical protein